MMRGGRRENAEKKANYAEASFSIDPGSSTVYVYTIKCLV
jgi:cytochrome c oxidase assembly protein Cox11